MLREWLKEFEEFCMTLQDFNVFIPKNYSKLSQESEFNLKFSILNNHDSTIQKWLSLATNYSPLIRDPAHEKN